MNKIDFQKTVYYDYLAIYELNAIISFTMFQVYYTKEVY